jgi:hypothetical protein
MTKRERFLTTALVGTAVVLGGGFLFHLFVYQPLSEARERLARAQEGLIKKQNELTAEQRQGQTILRVDPRLQHWQKLSLPPRNPEVKAVGLSPEEQKARHLSRLQVEYDRYLRQLLSDSGFARGSVQISPRQQAERGAASPAAKKNPPPYDRLVFGVSGRASLEAVTRMLYEFYRTNLLHQVRTLTLSLPQRTGESGGGRRGVGRGDLDVNLTVEAIMVSGGEERTTLLPAGLPGAPRVLADPPRVYPDIAKKNMFTGVDAAPTREGEERREVLRFVRLTTLFYNGRRWEGCFYDQAKGGDERRVNAFTLDELTVRDKFNNPVLEATVVLVDERQLIFRADGKFYRLHCGDFLYPAINNPLSDKEVKELGLSTSDSP